MSDVNVMIHTCNKREWYVYNHILPSLKQQGMNMDNVKVWHDYKRIGNLQSFLHSLTWIEGVYQPAAAVWHLQDDILLSSSFVERASTYPDDEICCGFVHDSFNKGELQKTGRVAMKHLWYSFPCIKIPVSLSTQFHTWLFSQGLRNSKYHSLFVTGKADDSLFRYFLLQKHSRSHIHNIKPNLVEHVDWLIGGSVVNGERSKKAVRAYYWDEQDLVDKLKDELVKQGRFVE